MIDFIIKSNKLFDEAVCYYIVKLLEEYNIDTSALPLSKSDDIVRPTCITKEDVEIHG